MQLQQVYDELKDKNEIAITDKYSSDAKFCTAVLISKIIRYYFFTRTFNMCTYMYVYCTALKLKLIPYILMHIST